MNYTALSILFLAAAAVVLALALTLQPQRRALVRRWWLPVAVSGVVVLVLTAVFDNVMIGVGLVAYDPQVNSGVAVGLAPLEDFAYPVAGLMLLPALWLMLRRRGTDARR